MKKNMLFVLLIISGLAFNVLAGTIKETFMVPMRDGVRLATDVYRPDSDRSYPVILYRTPYNKDTDGFDESIIKLLNAVGYVYIAQDCRGRFHSEGIDSVFLTDGWGRLQDGYDTIEWIVQQSWCNGKVGMIGGSATGITSLRAAGALHPNMVCAAVMVAPSDFYHQVVYPGGEFRKAIAENWIRGQRSDYMIDYFLQFPYYDELWEGMNLHTRTSMITIPILHFGGWYDCFSEGTILAFRDLHAQEKAGPQKLIMGPWTHGSPDENGRVGEMRYPQSYFYWESLVFLWLDRWLRDITNYVLDKPDVTYYLMGDPDKTDEMGCEWLTANNWPPENARQRIFYFTASGGLDEQLPSEQNEISYVFDPANPVPTHGGNNLTIAMGPYDQRAIGQRDDVLSFVTPVLTTPLRMEGFVRGQLYVTSNRPDTDFTLKLIDVYPDGREMLVTDGIRRVRFREGYRQEEVKLLQPGEVVALEVELPPTAIVFNSGHRIKVCISSSNFPRYEVNPNTDNEPNDRSDAQIANNSVFIGGEKASRVLLPVVPVETGIRREPETAKTFQLSANYPNPFNASTRIRYSLPAPDFVFLDIFNVNGQHVRSLEKSIQDAGEHVVTWDGLNDAGQPVPSSVYFYQIRTRKYSQVRKMLMIR